MNEEYKNLALTDNKEKQRFELEIDSKLAFITYKLKDEQLQLLHTEVDPALSGKGVGKAIVEKVLQYAEREQIRIIPYCEMISGFIQKNPEWQRLVAN